MAKADSRQQPRGSRRQPVCDPCAEYQRGERDNVTYAGAVIHACAFVIDGWMPRECPCGCVMTAAVSGGEPTP